MNTDTVNDYIAIGEDVWFVTLRGYIGYRITAIGDDSVEVTFEPSYHRTLLAKQVKIKTPTRLQVKLSDLYLSVDSVGTPVLKAEF
jgi:hypothetical protein